MRVHMWKGTQQQVLNKCLTFNFRYTGLTDRTLPKCVKQLSTEPLLVLLIEPTMLYLIIDVIYLFLNHTYILDT